MNVWCMNNKAVIYQGKAIKLEMYKTLKYYTTVHKDLFCILFWVWAVIHHLMASRL